MKGVARITEKKKEKKYTLKISQRFNVKESAINLSMFDRTKNSISLFLSACTPLFVPRPSSGQTVVRAASTAVPTSGTLLGSSGGGQELQPGWESGQT